MRQDSSAISRFRRVRPCGLIVLAGVFLTAQGCSKTGSQTYSLVFYQIRFDLPWTVDPQQIQSSRPKPPAVGFKITHDSQDLELLDGQLKLNGKRYGIVKAGDHVRVTEDGKVFVNGEERRSNGKM